MKYAPMDVSKERKALLAWMPHMIGLAFTLRHHYVTEEQTKQMCGQAGMIAFTDGDAVFYADRYKDLSQPERNFSFLHELLHGVLCHPMRLKLLRLRLGYVRVILANYGADAIVNEAIIADPATQNAVFTMPKKFKIVLMQTIHDIMSEAIIFSGATPPDSYDPLAKLGLQMEIVYGWLNWAYEAVKESRLKEAGEGMQAGQGGPASKNLSSGSLNAPEDHDEDDAAAGPTGSESSEPATARGRTRIEDIVESEEAWDLQESARDDTSESHADLIDKANRAVSDARGRIEAIVQSLKMQGQGHGQMLLSLADDLPPAVIPWNQVVRKVVTRDLTTSMRDSYTRMSPPMRSSIAMGRRAPYSPGTTIYNDRPRLLCVLDVSASHISSLKQCFAEIWAIARLKDAAVDLVTFDDGVREKMEIRSRKDFDRILQKGLLGGGGTALRDLFAEVAAMRTPYRSMIIMTDGYLEPPQNTDGRSILWVVTPGGNGDKLHQSGRVINMPEFRNVGLAA